MTAALDDVVDPCSQAMGVPIGLAEMGMATIDHVDPDTGHVRVRLRLTSPCCAYGPTMAQALEARLRELRGVVTATVSIDYEAAWEQHMIAPAAATRLDDRRRTTVALTGVRPYDWEARRDGGPRDG